MRAYQATGPDDEMCEVVIADNAKEARKIAWQKSDWLSDHCDGNYLELRVKWLREADVTGLAKGLMTDYVEGLMRGFYSWCEDTCPVCDVDGTLYLYVDDKGNKHVSCGCDEED